MMWQSLNALDLKDIGSWPRKARWLFIGILCVGVFGVGYFLLIQEQKNVWHQLADDEIKMRKDFEQYQNRAVSLSHYRSQLLDMEKAFKAMLRQLPDQAGVADLLVEVSQTGLAAGLQFLLFQPQQEIAQAFYAELPIKLRVLGDYHQFGEFVSGLAALPRIVTLHDIEIQPQYKMPQGKPLLIMDATAKTYRYTKEVSE